MTNSSGADHRHVYERVRPVDTRPWVKRVFCAQLDTVHRCSICLASIDDIIADLEEQEAAIKAQLEEALSNLPRQRAHLEYEFDGYNEIGAMG